EAFETLNIPVIGYRTNEFPAFYSSVSGLSLSHRAETAEELSRILHAKWDLGLHGGVLIANPIPPAYDMDGAATERLIDEALYRAKHQDISGKAVTPFLLKYLNENSDGKLPEANRQLLWNNAKLAAEVAVAFYH
ncbi:MAG: pseudouridine-5'-phosphate glycosidase, partial [Nitrospirota bacterium]|nr:pseudouridine-5'-phosphate glycosidase [Nitrospirota bacterium]